VPLSIVRLEKASTIVIGDPLNAESHIGPLCTTVQVERIEDTLDKAKSQGASIVLGGERPKDLSNEIAGGSYFSPTLVDCPDDQIETLKVEMFGPVMSVVTFETEEEAITMANNSVFGLGSGVFTQNLARAHRVSKKLKAGICWVNTYRAISPIAPFGGYNESGYGREAGLDAVLDYTNTKTTWINISDAPMANPFVIR